MNILFLTLLDFSSVKEKGIYTDLIRQFIINGHKVFVVSPVERAEAPKSRIIKEKNSVILKLKIGKTQKTNIIRKGFSTIRIESIFIAGIKQYFSKVKFDLVIYSTPPITLVGVIDFIKKRDGARTYLLLKDIFPQNAVDLGMLSKSGLKGFIYRYFRTKERKLYSLSDHIGCMSQANVDYVIKCNPEINPSIVKVCPNCIEVQDMRVTQKERDLMRKKYNIPSDKKVFVYGGNLGKPQGIPFLIKCLKTQLYNTKAYFLIVGDGTEFGKLEAFFTEMKPTNMRLMKRLSKEDYDRMIAACDIGMIFLDHRFTIPNFPSRLLSYMQAGLPVLACTDPNTDIGKVIVEGGFGWWCESNDVKAFSECVQEALEGIPEASKKEWQYLGNYYSSEIGYQIIRRDMNL